MGQSIAAAIGAFAFWGFIAAAAVTSILSQYFKHRETQKTIRQAIEKGDALDPETLSRLIAANNPPPPKRRGLAFLGTLFVCLGVGIGLLGWFGSLDKPEMLHQALGVASLLGMLGVPFFVASWMAKPDGAADK